MILFNRFRIDSPKMVAINNSPKFTIKKYALLSYSYQKLAKTPESLFPIEVERKNPPIINAVSRGGESLETNDSPIGDNISSPKVITP